MKIKNAKVYIGTIKECLNISKYKLYGDQRKYMATEWNTMTTNFQSSIQENYTKNVNEQAIIIKTEDNDFYEYKLAYAIKNNTGIKLKNPIFSIPTKPEHTGSTFLDENTLVPYYEEQPKVLNLKKLRKDLLEDPRIKCGIEN